MRFAAQPLLRAQPKPRAATGWEYQRRRRSVIDSAERPGIVQDERAADGLSMSKDELIIQLVKVALGILIAGYFFWWSLEVLNRLPPPH
jgi:hypothetical protein